MSYDKNEFVARVMAHLPDGPITKESYRTRMLSHLQQTGQKPLYVCMCTEDDTQSLPQLHERIAFTSCSWCPAQVNIDKKLFPGHDVCTVICNQCTLEHMRAQEGK